MIKKHLSSKKMNVPRYLTLQEIENILDRTVPYENNRMFIQKDPNAKREMLFNIRSNLKEQLKFVKLTPDAFDDLDQSIMLKLQKSLADPGYMVGITVAESFGQEVSQAALNSKRLTGAGSDITGGLAAVKAVLSGSKGAIAPAHIFFKNPYFTVYDIYRMAAQFNYYTVKRVTKGDPILLHIEDVDEGYWVPLYKNIHGNMPFEPRHVIRMYLNMDLIYKNQISISSIVKALEDSTSGNYLYPIPTPLTIETGQPYIDIYVDSTSIENFVQKETKDIVQGSVEIFMFNVFNVRDIHIKGIPHLLYMKPASVPMKKCVLMSVPIEVSNEDVEVVLEQGGSVDMLENIYVVKLNIFFMRQYGIPLEKLEKLIEACGMDILPASEENDEVLIVKTYEKKLPENILTEKIFKASDEQDALFKKYLKENASFLPPLNEIYKLSQHYYSTVKVEKEKDKQFDILAPLARYKIIDSSLCYSGDMYENLDVLGVIGMKNYLNEKISSLISGAGGSPIWMHVDLMTSYMCRLGNMTKFNLKGVEQEAGGLASSLLWKNQFNIISNAASMGKSSAGQTLADAKLLNANLRAGSYISDVFEDKQKEREYLEEKRKRQEEKDAILKMAQEKEKVTLNDLEKIIEQRKKAYAPAPVKEEKVRKKKEKEVIKPKEEKKAPIRKVVRTTKKKKEIDLDEL